MAKPNVVTFLARDRVW